MFDWLKKTDESLFLLINSCHNQVLDTIMPYLTSLWMWIPLFLWLIYKLFVLYEKKSIYIILLGFIMIALSDQGSGLIKNTIKRYRPTHNVEIGQKVHIVDGYKGGQYGFVSSHAANAFALAVFIFFLLKPHKHHYLIAALFLWALIYCYSRIYLGVHYPLDLLGGSLLGTSLGYLFYKLYVKLLA